ncbi:MAG: tRNA pseudouridine(55) synthase TruB [Candidatus Omnitrophica bacterium]|nr:tRNA pseudouridine(55) synthase TruB [Candidatus Omnitrophota bacterium]MBI5143881.1 tRNA pseudouridine(55) synthase TruB [Candidatus Omnitrophota bacterium]
MDGILVVDKPQGMTSHDVVDFIRRRFGLDHVGHAGTLDPLATGVLVMLIGGFTRYFNSLSGDDKVYEAALVLGATSDTGDASGKMVFIDKSVSTRYKIETIEEVFKKFLGDIEQTPPMYSAIKYRGKKLYELARSGVSVKIEPRRVSIKRLEILKISLPEIFFNVACSKGTYIRQLCVDIGKELGCGAYMKDLRRIRSGRFTIDDAVEFTSLKEMTAKELEKRLHNL